ncbi:nuclear pore complex protein Nup160 homolog isoform X2 [Uranotaenia lowii]|uniref:nuclear pore complex protein Nup160 homolog isoform X2 n=1 Tax=Uranotaenia lowii TaxID=190385 RepID=UPI002479115E|nr:nuclear pore complex protein Nup160 homolog isoform X2 [Uranotaenia lowii]XP_055609909.1 nuclear pore complex protein Nup160 homolog isoform X2 [Uranotaenia lowii]
MRKAALIAYEKAMRCQLECNSLVFLKMRCEVLLKCINALNLAASDYTWIVKPSVSTYGGATRLEESDTKIVIVDLVDIRKELIITQTVLEIFKQLDDYKAVLNVDTNELLVILANAKLYTTAFKLANMLGKSLTMIYESLAASCAMCACRKLRTILIGCIKTKNLF